MPDVTDGYVLTADSSDPSGQVWAAASGGISGIAVKDAGSTVGTRGGINFIEGSNVTLTITDDAGNDEVDVTIASSGGGGGAAVAQVVTATSSLSETDGTGSMALIRGGSTPYEFLALIYDATYGKWVSAATPLIMMGNTFTDTGTSYTSQLTQNSLMIGNILGYRALYDAGARLQFRLKGLLSNNGANNTFAQLQGAEFSDGDTAATSIFTACEISNSGTTGVFKVSAWTEPAGWTPADSHMRVVVQTKVAAGTGSYFQLFAEYRWTAAA